MASKEAVLSTQAMPVELDAGRDGNPFSTNSAPHTTARPLDHGAPEVVQHTTGGQHLSDVAPPRAVHDYPVGHKLTWKEKFIFFKTKDFWLILLLGQILALCLTGTNALTTLLVIEGTSIPAFQSLFNYVLLCLIYTPWTIYKYGFKKYGKMLLKDGWKCKFSCLQEDVHLDMEFSALTESVNRYHFELLRCRGQLLHRARVSVHHHPIGTTN